jgi:hypothetical protein
MSKEAYYFSHDANARHDPKILAMRSEFGIQGYGVYWVIVEMLREQEDYKLPMKKYIWNAIAMQVQCKDYANDNAKSFVESCINEYELFNSDGDFFWSNSLLKRMEKKNDVSQKRSKAAKARWEKASDTNDSQETKDENAMQNNAIAMQSDAIKGKERKGNKNKLKDISSKDDESLENEFNRFWDAYPKKVDKKKAFEKFKVAFKKHGADKIIEGAKKYAKECEVKGTEKQFIKHATTFLNAESFLNEFEVNISTHQKDNVIRYKPLNLEDL